MCLSTYFLQQNTPSYSTDDILLTSAFDPSGFFTTL
jgi:hypothetical protein